MPKKNLNKINDVYVAFLDGDILFASEDEDEVYDYIDQHELDAIQQTADEYDWDVDVEDEFERAAIQNGIDSGEYLVERINVNELRKSSEYELSDGTLIDSQIILQFL